MPLSGLYYGLPHPQHTNGPRRRRVVRLLSRPAPGRMLYLSLVILNLLIYSYLSIIWGVRFGYPE